MVVEVAVKVVIKVIITILDHPKAETFDVIIIGTIIICDPMASVLFNLASTFCYVSMKFSFGWDLDYEYLDTPMYVSTLVRCCIH